MKSLPNIDYKKLQKKAQEKPIGKYGNLINYLKEQGVEVDEATVDKKMRTFFEDLITEILKNPTQWDRTRNINFMELFKYLSGQEQETPQGQPEQQPEHEIEKMGKRAEKLDWYDEIPEYPYDKSKQFYKDSNEVGKKYLFKGIKIRIVKDNQYGGWTVIQNINTGKYTDFYSINEIKQLSKSV